MRGTNPFSTFLTMEIVRSVSVQLMVLVLAVVMYLVAAVFLGMDERARMAFLVFIAQVPGWLLIQAVWLRMTGIRASWLRDICAAVLGPLLGSVIGVQLFSILSGNWAFTVQMGQAAVLVGIIWFALTYLPVWIVLFLVKSGYLWWRRAERGV